MALPRGAQAQAAASRAAPVAMPARKKYCTAQGSQAVGVEHGHVRVRVLGRDAQDATGPAAATLDLLPGQIVDIRNGQAEAVRQADAVAIKDIEKTTNHDVKAVARPMT